MEQDLSNIQVLIVDDSAIVRKAVKKAVIQAGVNEHGIREAEHGAVALEKLDDLIPDIVFLDVNMPRVDGFEFLERFELQRSRPGAPDTGVILLVSPHDPRGHRERALQFSSVVGFVTKMPTNSADLLRQIGLGLSADPS